MWMTEEDPEKFAELVVRECADIAYEVGLHRQTKHEILRRFGLKVTDEDKADKQEPWVKTYCGGKPNYTEPVQDEGWYGQWQLRCGYERGWDKAMERKREWVGLTDEDIWQLRREGAHEVSDKDFKAIEAKLKEKNNG